MSVPLSLSLVLVSLSLVLPVPVSAVPLVPALVLVEASLALSCPLGPEQATSHIQLPLTRTNVRNVMGSQSGGLGRACRERLLNAWPCCAFSLVAGRAVAVDHERMAEASDGGKETIYKQLATECEAMLRYALNYGLVVNPTICEVVTAALGETKDPPSVVQLTKAHRLLSTIVAPATPLGILSVHARPWYRIPLLSSFVAVAVLSILGMLGIGISPLVEIGPGAGNPMLSGGMVLLINQLYFISIASLGACFHGLFTVNRYIVQGTYDGIYATTYLVRYLLGVMSGLILASLIQIDQDGALSALARPLLALIGGFSASVVYRVMQRLVETVERLLGVDTDKVEAKQRSRDIEEPFDLRVDELRAPRVEQPTAEPVQPPETTQPPEPAQPPAS